MPASRLQSSSNRAQVQPETTPALTPTLEVLPVGPCYAE